MNVLSLISKEIFEKFQEQLVVSAELLTVSFINWDWLKELIYKESLFSRLLVEDYA